MTARSFVVEDRVPRSLSRDEATAALGKADFVWVHFDDCEEITQSWLRTHGGLSELVVTALIATETRPRLEQFDDGALVNLRGPDTTIDVTPDLLSSIRLWVARGRVFSVTRRDLAALDVIEAGFASGKVHDPGDFVATLAAEITIELDPDVAQLGDTLDDCEERVGERGSLALRRRIAKARRRAIGYRRFLSPQHTALERLAKLDVDWLDDDDRMYLNEAADRAARMTEELEAIRERAALLHEQLTDLRAETIDTRTLVISIVAMIFLPLTFLTGLVGMNVPIPFAGVPHIFWVIVGGCLALSAAIALYFTRAHWFR